MSRSTSQILHAAADLLEEPDAWMQGGYAHDASHNILEPTSNGQWIEAEAGRYTAKPVCWCALGAIAQVCGIGEGQFDSEKAADILALEILGKTSSMPGSIIANWNDATERTQGDVTKAFRSAAKIAERAE